jgi:DNA polymerase I
MPRPLSPLVLLPQRCAGQSSLSMDRLMSKPSPLQNCLPLSADEPAVTPAEAPAVRPDLASQDLLKQLAGKTVWVIDAHSLIFQVFHALPEMSGPHGQPVGAVFGFTRDLFYLLQQKQPDYLFCAFDLSGPTFRHELYGDYKMNRAEMPDSLQSQLPLIHQVLDALGVPEVSYPGHEADDVLATLARQVDQAGGRCLLVTGDKDCRQLISERVQIYNIRADRTVDAEAVRAEWGIEPRQVVDFQALVGDPVDNVPGVPLIGPKIAGQLLAQYRSLEGIYEHLSEISGTKRRQNLEQYREQALLSRELVRLVDDLPLAIDWREGRPGRYDQQRTLALFRELGFRGLSRQLTELAGELLPAPEAGPPTAGRYVLIETIDQLRELAEQLQRQPAFALDTETTDLRPRWAQLVGLSFAWQAGEAYYVPVRAPAGQPRLAWEEVRAILQPILEDPRVQKRGQNLKYDLIALRAAGVRVRGVHFDTMVASYLLDTGQQTHRLDDLAQRYLGVVPIPITDLIGKGCEASCLDEVEVGRVCRYAAEDADLSWRLAEILSQRLATEGLERLFYELEMPLVEVLAELEYTGMAVDTDLLAVLARQFQERLEELEAEAYALAGHTLNLASPRQLAQVLFEERKLPVIKKTKTGPSTDVEVLEQLARIDPLPAKIIQHRQYAKLKGTYVDALPLLVHPQTGRVHTSLNQVVTATGRLSSNEPNLQNIPVRTEAGRQIRAAFIPGSRDCRLLAADYSQIELRVMAHFSQDQTLLDAFAEDADVHARVASEVYGVPVAGVDADMRRSAKAINFGIIYGQSPFGLARVLDIEQDQAAAYIETYFARHRGVEDFIENLLAECQRNGYVTSIFGRRRRIIGVRDPSRRRSSRQRTLPERTAINTVIQGSAADLIKQAMIHVYRRLESQSIPARMLLQIHDELVFEVHAAAVDELARLVTDEMARVADLSVPLKVDVRHGTNWAACEPWQTSS